MRRRDEVLVGLFTIIAIVGLVMGMRWLARGGLSSGYPLYAQFPWGSGLKEGQAVLFSGVNVGYVEKVDLLENGGLVVHMRIYHDKKVPDQTVASIVPNGIFGDQNIALQHSGGPTGKWHVAGDTLPSGPGATQLSDVLAKVDTIARSLTSLMTSLHKELIDDKTIAGIRKTVLSADSMFRTISTVAQTQSAELAKSQESLRRVASAIDSAKLNSTIDGFRETTSHLNTLLDSLGATNVQLHGILTKLETGDGTASRLLNSPKMEVDMRALLVRFDSLLTDFQKNPKKYIRISIF
ncbi:MAG TPA: MlaD family protein [Gemmatimonadaceae bacterium]|nr:MlaD family protein [Gemmatimonadaceae bacterium]